MRRTQLQVSDEDKIRIELDQLLADKIGPPPPDQKYLDQLYAEGAERFKVMIPPGYMDQKKSGQSETTDFSYNGLNYKRQFGDLILWRQILAYAKDKKPNGIIFVTDDKKEDWWWEVEALGKKTIGPRPELVDEMLREAGTRFTMYTSERFMQYSINYLSVSVREESIQQIRDVAEVIKQPESARQNYQELLIDAVAIWCKSAFPGEFYFESPNEGPDLVITRENQPSIAFDVKQLGIEVE
jgi:hypothetical protein